MDPGVILQSESYIRVWNRNLMVLFNGVKRRTPLPTERWIREPTINRMRDVGRYFRVIEYDADWSYLLPASHIAM